MDNYVEISKQAAIEIMKQNLAVLKRCYHINTFHLLSYDLGKNVFIGNKSFDLEGGMYILTKSNTFILCKGTEEQNETSILSIYTAVQNDIYNIMPIGEKHDMIIMPSK